MDLVRWQPKLLSSLALGAKEFEPLSNMNYPCLLRMKYHAQLLPYPLRCNYRRSRLCRGLAGDHPIVARSRGFRRACGTTQPSVYCQDVAPHFAFAYRFAYSGATRRLCQSS